MRTRLMTRLARTMLLCLLGATAFSATGSELATQKNAAGGVTVEVTPQKVSGDAKTWNFKIVFDTHSQDLTDDLVKSSVLLDESGARHLPVAWDGAAPGGHHRTGVLRFSPLRSQPRQIELQITRAGEPAPRSFRWRLD